MKNIFILTSSLFYFPASLLASSPCQTLKEKIHHKIEQQKLVSSWPKLEKFEFYKDLLRKQAEQKTKEQLDQWESLILQMPRPLIADIKNKPSKRTAGFIHIVQGNRRFEGIKPGQYVDMFIKQDNKPLPQELIVLEKDIPFEMILTINSLSSRGSEKSNPSMIELFTKKYPTYRRVLAPYEFCFTTFSNVDHVIQADLLPELKELLNDETQFENFIKSPAFKMGSLNEKKSLLEEKIKELKKN